MNSIIVIPTYNEKNNIQPLVEEIFKVAPDVRNLIVADNSPDGTGRIADQLSNTHHNTQCPHKCPKCPDTFLFGLETVWLMSGI